MNKSQEHIISSFVIMLPLRLREKLLNKTESDSLRPSPMHIIIANEIYTDNNSMQEEVVSPTNYIIKRKQDDIKIQKDNGGNRQKHISQDEPIASAFQKPSVNINNYFPSEDCTPNWLQTYHSKNKMLEVLLRDLLILNSLINDIIRSQLFVEKWEDYLKIRKSMQDIYMKLVENNLKFICKNNISLYFWKILFYHVIEYFRTMMRKNMLSEERILKSHLNYIINNGYDFFEKLLQILKKRYNFHDSHQSEAPETDTQRKLLVIAKVTAQTLYLHLGDLARYEEQMKGTSDYSRSKVYYNEAQKLVPCNGIPYNQLALLSIYANKKFQAVYYHMRSLMATNSVDSAKESLKVLFDEIRKKYDENFKLIEGETESKELCFEITPARKEIWVHPCSHQRSFRITPYSTKQFYFLDENILKSLPPGKLFKHFITSYLYILGKLFTGIGLEVFNKALYEMLSEFQLLIEGESNLIYTGSYLQRIILLNIFAIECHKTEQENSRTEIRNHAFNVSSLMFAVALNQANKILKNYLTGLQGNNKEILFSDIPAPYQDNVNTILQAVQIWCNWLQLNINMWNPPSLSISVYNFVSEYEMNPWDGFAEMMTMLHSFESFLSCTQDFSYQKLPEDEYCNGFLPLSVLIKERTIECVNPNIQFLVRIKRILNFGYEYLIGCEPPILTKLHNNNKTIFINVVNEIYDCKKNSFKEIFVDQLDNMDTAFENSVEEAYHLEDTEIKKLLKRKQELEKERHIQKTYKQNFSQILQTVGRAWCLEVQPKYLVPDTNCFIDSLPDLQVIINELRCFTLTIPLAVVSELTGLSKGFKTTSSSSLFQISSTKIRHSDEVSYISSKALDFIQSNSSVIKFVTTKGTILSSANFTFENNDEKYTSNDDKILESACGITKTSVTLVDDTSFIVTSVVLLTTDRNLRVKALSRHLPVSELQEFLKWARSQV